MVDCRMGKPSLGLNPSQIQALNLSPKHFCQPYLSQNRTPAHNRMPTSLPFLQPSPSSPTRYFLLESPWDGSHGTG